MTAPPASRPRAQAWLAQRLHTLRGGRGSWDARIVTCSRLVQNGLGFALSLAMVHKFGLAGVGLLTIASVGVVIQSTLLSFGLPYVLARSNASLAQRNAMAATLAVASVGLSLPLGAALGAVFGHDTKEATVIMLLALGGPYFAQSAVAEALLVLQGRMPRIALSMLGSLLGLLTAFVATDNLLAFATVLALGRFIGLACIHLGLPWARFDIASLRRMLREGVRFLLPDTLSLAADQAVVAIVSLLTTRPELGVFGLCRQLLTLADTPLWSKLVTSYPRVCGEPELAVALGRQMFRRGLVLAVILALASPVLGHWVYHVTQVAWLGPMMMVCVPLRYVAGTAEISLRALVDLTAVHKLTAAKCGLVGLFPIGIWSAGLAGAALALILHTALIAWMARRMLAAALARSARPLEPLAETSPLPSGVTEATVR